MSKKQERIQKLVCIHKVLTHPMSGASKKAEKIAYWKPTMEATIDILEDILKSEGVSFVNANDKVGSQPMTKHRGKAKRAKTHVQTKRSPSNYQKVVEKAHGYATRRNNRNFYFKCKCRGE